MGNHGEPRGTTGYYRAASAARIPALSTDSGGGGVNGKEKQKVKSWIWEHTHDMHAGLVGDDGGIQDFNFKVAGTFRKCLQRQVDENVRIQNCESGVGHLLNSKREYFSSKSVIPYFKHW